MLTITQVSERLGVCEGTVRRYIRQGRLAALKNQQTRRVRIEEGALEAFLLTNDSWEPAATEVLDAEIADADEPHDEAAA